MRKLFFALLIISLEICSSKIKETKIVDKSSVDKESSLKSDIVVSGPIEEEVKPKTDDKINMPDNEKVIKW